jgi:hypothetical protein
MMLFRGYWSNKSLSTYYNQVYRDSLEKDILDGVVIKFGDDFEESQHSQLERAFETKGNTILLQYYLFGKYLLIL